MQNYNLCSKEWQSIVNFLTEGKKTEDEDGRKNRKTTEPKTLSTLGTLSTSNFPYFCFMKKPTKILFVCLGNICRSPSAEAVFKGLVEKKSENELFEIDSAGTSDYHEGQPADERMMKHAIETKL